MRITGSSEIGHTTLNKTSTQATVIVPVEENVVKQGSETTHNFTKNVEQILQAGNDEETKVKVQDAVEKMNTMLEVNQNAAKFKYHEGLDRYYVTVVDRNTDEVIKEIPPKKLLDAFYEMQKMFGMIVDEKI